MTSYSSFKQKLGILKAILESDEGFSLGKAIEINRSKMSIPIEIETGATFQIQLPECGTKQGVVSTGTRTYIDLMFDNNSSSKDFLVEFEEFVSLLQSKCAKEIYKNRADWLVSDSDEPDEHQSIETFEEMFYPVVRAINRGSNTVIRVDIGRGSRGLSASIPSETSCEVYNKTGEERSLSSIHKNSRLIPLIEFSEVLISSTSINLVVELKECLLLDVPCEVTRRERNILFENDDTNETTEKTAPEDQQGVDQEEEQGVEQEVEQEEETLSIASRDELAPVMNEMDEEKDSNCLGLDELEEVDIQVEDENSHVENDIEEGLTEVKELDIASSETLTLKQPNEVYREIYKAAISKAKRLRQVALDAYLDAKKIKARFMLEDIDDEDEDDEIDDSEDYVQTTFH
jgi:hypothetical protein